MGCGGSKEVLEGCEKPLCHRMEKMEIESIDATFEKISNIITQVEQKRKFLCDDLMDNYYNTGAYAYKCPDPQKALECAVWRLAVDNKGKVSDIGMNSETMCFEGNQNSEKGNCAANGLINYFKCLTNEMKMEDMTAIADQLTECVNEITSNMEQYTNDIKDKCSSEPLKMMKCCGYLKTNLSKATCALNSCKDLCNKMKELVECAPAMMANCSPDKLLDQQAHVDKAMKSKQTENLPIAYCVIASEHRRGKKCQDAENCYQMKLKARKECLDKLAQA